MKYLYTTGTSHRGEFNQQQTHRLVRNRSCLPGRLVLDLNERSCQPAGRHP
jgi:hypothetical protein